MHGEYYVQLLCPYCPRWKWLRLHGPQLTLEDVVENLWAFKCPVHGLLLEKPFQAHESGIPFRVYRSNCMADLLQVRPRMPS